MFGSVWIQFDSIHSIGPFNTHENLVKSGRIDELVAEMENVEESRGWNPPKDFCQYHIRPSSLWIISQLDTPRIRLSSVGLDHWPFMAIFKFVLLRYVRVWRAEQNIRFLVNGFWDCVPSSWKTQSRSLTLEDYHAILNGDYAVYRSLSIARQDSRCRVFSMSRCFVFSSGRVPYQCPESLLSRKNPV